MTDALGILSLPVSIAEPVGDPLRATIGSYLQAAIRYYCNDAWSTLAPGTDVCERVEVNDPADNTFHTAKLPCLAIFRDDRSRKVVYLGNDISYRESSIVLLWVPPVAVQFHKAKRESFYQAIESAIVTALTRGRIPTWVVDGDTDSTAQWRGSHIGGQLGLMKPIHQSDMRFDDYTLSIEMMGEQPRKYPALRGMFTVWEQCQLDPTISTVPAALDPLTVGGSILSVNGVPWNTLDPTP